MTVLDTDHLSVIADERHSQHVYLKERLESVHGSVACTVVSLEEGLRGWMAVIGRTRDVSKQIGAYARLTDFIQFMNEWRILPFDEKAASQFLELRKQRVRIGTMDLKIASICLVHQAILITANRQDFSQVANLRCESWL
jgi:tRNA(fMet)-specific endonuclease VapC